LAEKHLNAQVNPNRLALFDLSSSWVTGTHCPLAARGHSRDAKKGWPQIEYGLLTDPGGRPVAVRVVAGNTADPTAFTGAAVRERFGLKQMVMAGDRGMITSARIEALPRWPPTPGPCRSGVLGWAASTLARSRSSRVISVLRSRMYAVEPCTIDARIVGAIGFALAGAARSRPTSSAGDFPPR
jgi:hypothetical protein